MLFHSLRAKFWESMINSSVRKPFSLVHYLPKMLQFIIMVAFSMITELFTEPPDFIEIEKELQADPWLQATAVSFKVGVLNISEELSSASPAS